MAISHYDALRQGVCIKKEMQDILTLIVPKEILAHFDYEQYREESGVFLIELVEKDDLDHIPKSILREGKVLHNGYMNSIDLQTYPLQGKEVFLRLKRRRWRMKHDETKKSYFNEYDFSFPGIKATKAFGAFLKEIGRG